MTMANFQRLTISVLLILTVSFLFFAQTSQATKGPKITNKVSIRVILRQRDTAYSMNRSTLISLMVMSHWAELSLVSMAKRHPKPLRISGLLLQGKKVLATKVQLSIE